MSVSAKPVLLLLGDADVHDEVRALISDVPVRVETAAVAEHAAARFDALAPDLLVFAFMNLEQAERCYLDLYRHARRIQVSDHRCLLVCKAHDSEAAYEMVKRRLFDDYVVIRPLYDPHRLGVCITHLLDERARQAHAAQEHVQVSGAYKAGEALRAQLAHQVDTGEEVAASIGTMRHDLETLTDAELHPRIEAACQPAQQSLAQVAGDGRWVLAEQAAPLQQAAAWLKAQPQRIVAVDDDAVYLKVLTLMLEQSGYEVMPFTDPRVALASLARLQPDAVLVDFEMPELTGCEFVQQAKALPQARDIPFLLITGHSDTATVAAAARAGASGFIVKPGKRELIVAKLREVLGNAPGRLKGGAT